MIGTVVERKAKGDISPSDFMKDCMESGAFDKNMGSILGGDEPETPPEDGAKEAEQLSDSPAISALNNRSCGSCGGFITQR